MVGAQLSQNLPISWPLLGLSCWPLKMHNGLGEAPTYQTGRCCAIFERGEWVIKTKSKRICCKFSYMLSTMLTLHLVNELISVLSFVCLPLPSISQSRYIVQQCATLYLAIKKGNQISPPKHESKYFVGNLQHARSTSRVSKFFTAFYSGGLPLV